MKTHKKDIGQFLVWMRNGISFCTTWFLILTLAYNALYDIETISTGSLIKMVLWVTGGVFLFTLLFSDAIIRKWSFISRLTCFMAAISIYECLGFYWLGIWSERGMLIEWLGFIGVIFVLYFVCIGIYQRYSRKQGELYTEALQKYQQQRSAEDGE